jgi:hypothetical protein
VPGLGAEVIAGNYMVRYLFGALGTAVVLPAIEHIGVGWFSTISALFMTFSAGTVWCTILWGKDWRDAVDGKRRMKRAKKMQKAAEKANLEHAQEVNGGAEVPVMEKGPAHDGAESVAPTAAVKN